MNEITIANRKVGENHEPFIIAEMSGNHNQSLEKALEIVDAAAATGVHALKLQTFTPDTMTLDVSENEFFISDPENLWKGQSLYELYQKAQTPWEWHEKIFERCKQHGLLCFSTPFDETAVDFLEALDVPAYKIASYENNHTPLIRKVAKTGKPIIISTGASTLATLEEIAQTMKQENNPNLIFLKCTSSYPAPPHDSNLLTIPHMKNLFDCQVGLSDHTLGIGAAIASIALGATMIEKHFTVSRAQGGIDAAFSLEPGEMKSLATETKRAWQALGKITYTPTKKEQKALLEKRSIYAAKDIKLGEKFTPENIKIVRPGLGLQPKHFDAILKGKASISIKKGTPLTWQMLQ